MFTRFIGFIGLVGTVGVMASVGCGGSGGGSSGDGGAGGTSSTTAAVTSGNTTTSGNNTTSGAGVADCCINTDHFTCTTLAAALACSDFNHPDPSGCQPSAVPCGDTSGPSTSSGNPSSSTGPEPQDDTGNQCELNSECIHNTCLFKDGADVGFCSKTCMDFTECPTFWSCSEISNGSITYCVPN